MHVVELPLLLVALTAVQLVAGSSNSMYDRETSACLGQISTYLDELGFRMDLDENGHEMKPVGESDLLVDQIRMALAQAEKHLKQTQSSDDSSDTVFWSLQATSDCPQDQLRSTVASLIGAFKDCDQVSLDYLMIVANFELPKSPALVNSLARNRVELCWQQFVSTVSRQLDRVMGKMVEPVFGNVEQVVESWLDVRNRFESAAEKAPVSRGTIHFDEDKAKERAKQEQERDELENPRTRAISVDQIDSNPETFASILAALKEIDFGNTLALRDLALSLNRLFNKRRGGQKTIFEPEERRRRVREFVGNFFLKPCQELVSRVKNTVALGDIYRRHIKQTLGKALAEEKRSNPRLDYELQIYRVCKLGLAKEKEICESLDKIC